MTRRKSILILPKLKGGKNDSAWYVEYSFRNPINGRMKRFRHYKGFDQYKTIAKKREYGLKIVKELKQKLQNGWNPFEEANIIFEDQLANNNAAKVFKQARASNKTVRLYANQFLKWKQTRVSDSTFKMYKSKLKRFVNWCKSKGYEQNDISSLTPDIISSFFDFLISSKELNTIYKGEYISKDTISSYKIVIQQFFTYLLDENIIKKLPYKKISIGNHTCDHAAKPVRKDDVDKIKEAIYLNNPQLWLSLLFEYYCAIRPGREMNNMKIRWIDFYKSTITVPAEFAKNKTTQTVLIPQQFLNILREEYQLHAFPKDDYVFSKNKKPGPEILTPRHLRSQYDRIRKKYNFDPKYTYYSLKHTGAIMAHDAGTPIKHLQLHMRHAHLSTTDRYLRRMRSTDSDAIRNNYPTL